MVGIIEEGRVVVEGLRLFEPVSLVNRKVEVCEDLRIQLNKVDIRGVKLTNDAFAVALGMMVERSGRGCVYL